MVLLVNTLRLLYKLMQAVDVLQTTDNRQNSKITNGQIFLILI